MREGKSRQRQQARDNEVTKNASLASLTEATRKTRTYPL
jgi:hypothetical protein